MMMMIIHVVAVIISNPVEWKPNLAILVYFIFKMLFTFINSYVNNNNNYYYY